MTTKLVIANSRQAFDALGILIRGQHKDRRSLIKDIVDSKDIGPIGCLLNSAFARRPSTHLEPKPRLTTAQVNSAFRILLRNGSWSDFTCTFEWLGRMRRYHNICSLFAEQALKKAGVTGAFHILRDLPVRRFRKIRLQAIKKILRSKSPSIWVHGWHGATALSSEEAVLLVGKVRRWARWGWVRGLLEENERTFLYGGEGRRVRRRLLPDKYVSVLIALLAKEKDISDLGRFFERRIQYVSRELTKEEGCTLAKRMLQLALLHVKKDEYNWQSSVGAVLRNKYCQEYLGQVRLDEFEKQVEKMVATKKIAAELKTTD